MKPFLSNLIDDSQGAFVSNRLITDNVIVVTESFHWLKTGLVGRNSQMFAVKACMSKPYDRIEWNYLNWILGKMGFSQAFQHLILQCVCSISFQILINEKLTLSFSPTCKLRQGNLLSPYLFILYVEDFSGLNKKAVEMGD